MSVKKLRTKVSSMSIDFSDYTPQARRAHEGKDVFIGVHVPRELAPHITLSTFINVEIEVPE